jgi:hypothetical protein
MYGEIVCKTDQSNNGQTYTFYECCEVISNVFAEAARLHLNPLQPQGMVAAAMDAH